MGTFARVCRTGIDSTYRPCARAIVGRQLAQPATSPSGRTHSLRGLIRMASSGTGHCSKDTPRLTAEVLKQKIKDLPAWKLNSAGDKISRSFVAKNFVAAIEFFQRVAEVAEEANHHPDLHLTNYRDVEIVLSTHVINGVSEIDLRVAAKLDALPVDYSPKWLREHGHAA